MTLLVASVTYRTAGHEFFERMAFEAGDGSIAPLGICDENIREAILVSTCNREEIYMEVAPNSIRKCYARALEAMSGYCSAPVAEIEKVAEEFLDISAVEHMFRVVSGLESMVPGEEQIVSQMRAALEAATGCGAAGPSLNRLFSEGFRVGKQARSALHLDGTDRSITHAGLAAAKEHLGDLDGITALIVGTGSISRQAGGLLRGNGARRIIVTGRTPAASTRLAADLEGESLPLSDLRTVLADCDLVVSATRSPRPFIGPEDLGSQVQRTEGHPLVVLDLAVPRDVHPSCADLPGVVLIDVERLGDIMNAGRPFHDLTAAELLAATKAVEYIRRQETPAVGNLIVNLRRRADEVTHEEFERLKHRLPGLAPPDHVEIATALRRTANKMLHHPIEVVKDLSRAPDVTESSAGVAAAESVPTHPPAQGTANGIRLHTPRRRFLPLAGRRTLLLGTRASLLARTQAQQVAQLLTESTGVDVELVPIVSDGDILTGPLQGISSTGVFVTALRAALMRGEVDFLVHSYKDLPATPCPGLFLAAVPPREDPRDALISHQGHSLAHLPPGSRIGTGAPRRRAQLLAVRPDLEIVPIRGNIDTRLRAVKEHRLDAVVLALAGLNRVNAVSSHCHPLPTDIMLPAPAQGALALECRTDDYTTRHLLAQLHHEPTAVTVSAERGFLAALNAGCSAPVAALASQLVSTATHDISLEGLITPENRGTPCRQRLTGRASQAYQLGQQLAERLQRLVTSTGVPNVRVIESNAQPSEGMP
jgi:glutamyl-tRNA reductase